MRNQRGITLIALVITIIVLLILAGVSIAMLTGDNGILKNADTAAEETAIANAKDAVSMAVNEALTNRYGEVYGNGSTSDQTILEAVESETGLGQFTTETEVDGAKIKYTPVVAATPGVAGTQGKVTIKFQEDLKVSASVDGEGNFSWDATATETPGTIPALPTE